MTVMEILSIFEQASGQKINISKSSVFFSRNVHQEVKNTVLGILGFHEADFNTHYLGLPNCMNRNKQAVLGYLKDRVRNRIQSWDSSLLNKSGKEVLLKTVTQSIPTYAMSVFLLPIEMCKDMENMMCKFWWKSGKKDKNIHWMSWERMCASKLHGGLGFRNIHEFNISLLGKQEWRFIVNPNSLVARIFKAKYFPKESFLGAKLGANPSFIWRSLLAAQNILRQGMGRRVGDGSTVFIENEPWLPSTENPYVITESDAIRGQKVSVLMWPNERKWDEDLIKDVFLERDANLILAIPLSDQNADGWYWRKEKYGHYSVKTAYTLMQETKTVGNQGVSTGFWKRLWLLQVPPKVKLFMWRASIGCLPTKEMLCIKKVNVNVACPLCNGEVESTSHLFLDCSFASACWDLVGIRRNNTTQRSFLEWAVQEFSEWSKEDRQVGAMLCWMIWNCRNDAVWNQKYKDVAEVVVSARVALSHWIEAQDKTFDRSWGLINPHDGAEQWTPPTENKTKINTDAAVYAQSNQYTYAFAARNGRGDLIEARSYCKEDHITPDCAEAMGIREALSWIKANNLEEVTVEADCLVVIQAIRGSATMSSYFGVVVQECRNLMQILNDKEVILRFVKRSANSLAHAFASYSYSYADRVWKGNDVPPEITRVLEYDLNQ